MAHSILTISIVTLPNNVTDLIDDFSPLISFCQTSPCDWDKTTERVSMAVLPEGNCRPAEASFKALFESTSNLSSNPFKVSGPSSFVTTYSSHVSMSVSSPKTIIDFDSSKTTPLLYSQAVSQMLEPNIHQIDEGRQKSEFKSKISNSNPFVHDNQRLPGHARTLAF